MALKQQQTSCGNFNSLTFCLNCLFNSFLITLAWASIINSNTNLSYSGLISLWIKESNKGERSGREEGERDIGEGEGEGRGGQVILGRVCWRWKRTKPGGECVWLDMLAFHLSINFVDLKKITYVSQINAVGM